MTIQLFVGTQKGAFVYSKDDAAGTTWSIAGPYFPGWKVSAAALDANGEFVVATSSYVYGAMIHRGTSFEDMPGVDAPPRYKEEQGFKLNEVWTLKRAGKRLLAGVDQAGVFASDDQGVTWYELDGLTGHPTRPQWFPGFGGLCAHHLTVNGDEIWCGISAVGVFYSADAGKTWTSRNQGVHVLIEDENHKEIGTCVHAIVADPEDPQRIWRQDHAGMYRTHDGGKEWELIQNGLPSTFGFPLVRDHDANVLFSAPLDSDQFRYPTDGKLAVYRSDDDGDSWQACRNGLPSDSYHAVLRQAMATDQHGGVYLGNAAGEVYASNDLGASFERLPGSLPRILCVEAFVTA
jgi:photosystem II stability/assembly factor-like uncharacterized protein